MTSSSMRTWYLRLNKQKRHKQNFMASWYIYLSFFLKITYAAYDMPNMLGSRFFLVQRIKKKQKKTIPHAICILIVIYVPSFSYLTFHAWISIAARILFFFHNADPPIVLCYWRSPHFVHIICDIRQIKKKSILSIYTDLWNLPLDNKMCPRHMESSRSLPLEN